MLLLLLWPAAIAASASTASASSAAALLLLPQLMLAVALLALALVFLSLLLANFCVSYIPRKRKFTGDRVLIVESSQPAKAHGKVAINSPYSVPANFIHLEDKVRVFLAWLSPGIAKNVPETFAGEIVDAVGLGIEEDIRRSSQAEIFNDFAVLPA